MRVPGSGAGARTARAWPADDDVALRDLQALLLRERGLTVSVCTLHRVVHTSYPSDVSDEEWAVAVPYLTLLAPHRLAAQVRAARRLQRGALSGAHRRAVALPAP
jgi:hypothetical protein